MPNLDIKSRGLNYTTIVYNGNRVVDNRNRVVDIKNKSNFG